VNRVSLHATLLALILPLFAACGDYGAGPGARSLEERPTEGLHFVRMGANAPALESLVVSFWAKRGEDREVRLRYKGGGGGGSGDDYCRFRVPANALLQRPNGAPVAPGDSVLITLTVVDASKYIVRFEPSGLRFSMSEPARLQFEFGNADKDLDENGVVNSNDTALRSQLAVWRQEASGLPWTKLSSKVEIDIDEVSADIVGFSGYALAY
jgi:hypothetical protein